MTAISSAANPVSPYTWGQLLTDIKAILFPAGEAYNQQPSHAKWFLDAIVDLQRNVDCLKGNNVNLVPQCSTFYKCGLTHFQAPPHSLIKKISVVDQISTNGVESATVPVDWCSEIQYDQVDFCHIKQYLDRSSRAGCCFPVGLWFGLGAGCGLPWYPTPTNASLPAGLAPLPLGYSYAQTSTDRRRGRARRGIWAKENDTVWVAPWIQSTETIIVYWEGVKRSWNIGDPVDSDPTILAAIEAYVRAKQRAIYDMDPGGSQEADGQFTVFRQDLFRDCREETRTRLCERSVARGSSGVLTALFYNTIQAYTANCPAGVSGNPVTVTIPPGTVASTISVGDANAQAIAQAQTQANAQLNCASSGVFYNDTAQIYTATCPACAAINAPLESGAPTPTGPSATVTVAAGTVQSTTSVADANAAAMAQAQADACSQLNGACTFYNAPQTATATCPNNASNTSTVTIAAGQYTSKTSQAAADLLALNAAQVQAQQNIITAGCNVVGNSTTGLSYTLNNAACNTETPTYPAPTIPVPTPGQNPILNPQQGPTYPVYPSAYVGTITVNVTSVIAYGATVGAANVAALALAAQWAQQMAAMLCGCINCFSADGTGDDVGAGGNFTFNYGSQIPLPPTTNVCPKGVCGSTGTT
jgi:hypothetical protein